MVFLGYERPVEQGREQVFDPVTAQMVLNANRDYINAVYNEYQQAKQDMKEFNKEYGDFTSPIQKDMDWYYNNVTGRIKNFINDLYAQGIDPLRSQEGRTAVARELATMPIKGIADRKQSAEIAKEYVKNVGLLSAKGKYNADAEKFFRRDLSTWDTGVNGIWQYSSPIEIDPLKALTESSYNNRTAHELTKEDVEKFGMKYDPNARYTGFTQNDLLNIANNISPGLYGTPQMDWYRELARRKVEASGQEVNDKNINTQLAYDIANSQQEYLIRPIADYTDYYHRENLAINREKLQIARDRAKKLKEQEENQLKGWTFRQALNSKIQNNIDSKFRGTFEDYIKSVEGGKGLSGDQKKLISKYYKSSQGIPEGDDQVSARAFFVNMNNPEKSSIVDIKRSPVYFNDNDINFTKLREYAYAGRDITAGSATNKFNSFLKRNHIEGFSTDNKITVNHTYTGDADFYDLNGTVKVKRTDLDRYFDMYDDNDKKVKAMENLGLTIVNKTGKIISPSGTKTKDIKYGDIEYVEIPCTRTMYSSNPYTNRLIDRSADAISLSKSTAAKRENSYITMWGDDEE